MPLLLSTLSSHNILFSSSVFSYKWCVYSKSPSSLDWLTINSCMDERRDYRTTKASNMRETCLKGKKEDLQWKKKAVIFTSFYSPVYAIMLAQKIYFWHFLIYVERTLSLPCNFISRVLHKLAVYWKWNHLLTEARPPYTALIYPAQCVHLLDVS